MNKMQLKLPFLSRPYAVTAAAIFVVVIGIQFVRPELTNPPVTAEINVPPQVKQILSTACYNCHSNQTQLLWFDRIVPAYWIVADDVRKARKHLNFSEIGALPVEQQKAALYEAINQMQFSAMPPRNYKSLHPESRITAEQLAILKNYLDPSGQNTAADTAQIAAADEQYNNWIKSGDTPVDVRPSPNEIKFIPEYKEWKTISTTDRLDNHTIRAVLGNDTAIRAIESNRITPWPDGTIFAKVAWDQLTDDKGVVRTGEFKQVEFMIKDSRKYASTAGWGWARWRGTDLQPYGKDASFVKECVGCHAPMHNKDFVFTMPIKGRK